MFVIYKDGHLGSTCQDCRDIAKAYIDRYKAGQTDRRHGGQTTQVILNVKENLPVGDPPQFQAEWQKRMYLEWLEDLKGQVTK